MNQDANTPAAESSQQALRAPRRQRIASAIASALVSGVLFGSVVLGMTSTGDASPRFVAQAHARAHA